jgi:peroxiredoxin Q/BCP
VHAALRAGAISHGKNGRLQHVDAALRSFTVSSGNLLLHCIIGDPMLHSGERAPDFELASGAGDKIKLSDFAGKKCVVLYFYPKDDTPGCTVEACSFRDAYDVFAEAGAEVIGVSSDSVSSHERFAKKHNLPMTLLSDADGSVRAKYGVKSTLGLFPGRVTFVIDKEGVVRHSFSSQLRFSKHVDEALEVVKKLK